MPAITYYYLGVSLSKTKRKTESIQWVIDKLGSDLVIKRERENHKTDGMRADEALSWCPKCKMKWNIFESIFYSSPDIRLWKEKICQRCDSLA